uniref:synaptopodin-2-like isoform X2 n=1 Tax=Pristiophorus japonicus TaxID=55135 RepID=UPI00398F456F
MGIGDYVCVAIDGGAPWGFRLQGGKEHKQPLQVSKVRKKSKACRAGLCEGDELISINSKPCSELTHSEAMQLIDGISDTLQILIKRPISEKTDQQDYTDYEGTKSRETVETTLQITGSKASCKQGHPFELYISESQDEAYYGETESDTDISGKKEENQKHNRSRLFLKECASFGESLQDTSSTEQREPQHSAMVEFQLSLTQRKLGDPETAAVTITGEEKMNSAALVPTVLRKSIQKTESAASETDGNAAVQRASAATSLQSRRDKKVKLVESELQGAEGDSYQSLDSSDREHSGREASTSEVGSGCADSLAEEGQSKTHSTPPFSIGISSEGTEHGSEETRSGKDLARTHKHRARQAKIRRSESLSEKQVKEAKSKCKSIALLLTATPTPSSKGALMFKKRRQRAKKYTLVSYGTGEFDPDDDQEDSIEFTLVPTSDSDLDEDFCADVNSAQIVTFDWDTGLVEVEKKEKTEDEMQRLPDTKGKGALLFAKRRQRIDQYTAEQEEMRRAGVSEAASNHSAKMESYYQTTKSSVNDSSITVQNHATENYSDVSKLHGIENVSGVRGRSEMIIQNLKSAEDNRAGAMNRTATPFPGVQNRAAAPFSPARNVASSLSDLPPPPTYSTISPQPDNVYRVASPPLATMAQPAIWSPTGIAGEQIASRDERICVPAIKTGILQDARKRNTSKPMFTFVDRPKVAPNPELLSMVKGKTDRRRGIDQPGGGFESGPEEDYLSLGAEASNFLQTPAVKQKTPPPVAPKPSVKSPPTGATPMLPPLSPAEVIHAEAPVHPSGSNNQMPVKSHSVQPVNTWYQSQGAANQFISSAGPRSVTSAHSYASKTPPTTPIANSGPAGGIGPAYEMPALKGKGAQLFARRQSRMEKFIVDSSTVKARQPRSSSPTPSMPASWKYSSNIRAPPPLAYNPIHSPSYPPGILKAQAQSASSSKSNKGAKGKSTKKPLNVLDVMKHQPYQLNPSLFTFSSAVDAKAPLSTSSSLSKQSIKSDPVPLQPVNAAYPVSKSVSSVPTGPSFNQANTVSADEEYVYPSGKNAFVPPSFASYPKQEPSALSAAMAPRPKFSAKKVGVTAQG